MWQSFDHPTDTWLPGAKFGYNKVTNDSQILTSWRSYENPAPGLFSTELEPKGTSYSLKWNRSNLYWTSGEWSGKIFSLLPEIDLNCYVKNLTFVSNENESYFIYSAASDFALSVCLDPRFERLRFAFLAFFFFFFFLRVLAKRVYCTVQ